MTNSHMPLVVVLLLVSAFRAVETRVLGMGLPVDSLEAAWSTNADVSFGKIEVSVWRTMSVASDDDHPCLGDHEVF